MIDVEALLKPISDATPSGRDLRLDAESDLLLRIGEHRSEVDPALDPDGKGKEPNWPEVAKLAEAVLRDHSKDLEVAGWLAEALLHLERFEGLAQGISLIRRTLESYWDGAFPGFDEDGITLAIRARPLSWLGSQGFLRAVRSCPFAPDAALDSSWGSREGALMLEDETLSAERRAELSNGGQVTRAAWEGAVNAQPRAQLEALLAAFSQCQDELRAIDAFCAERFGDEEPPNLYPLQTLLDELLDYLKAQGVGEAAEAGASSGEDQPMQQASATPAAAGGPIQSRQEALRQLREVGEFFKRSEPHSPISLLIARAARWGDMSFEQLVRDLARESDLKGVWETLGVSPGSSSEE